MLDIVRRIRAETGANTIFELGCGNGSVAARLTADGFSVTGVDPSVDGIQNAREQYPSLPLELGSSDDDLVSRFGRFPIVLSLEVVEHVYLPRVFARRVFELLEPEGTAIISTPYHGYMKNLALAVTGKLDDHFTALWDYGHIKFWSRRTLNALLMEAGLRQPQYYLVGRIPLLAKSMIAVTTKPSDG